MLFSLCCLVVVNSKYSRLTGLHDTSLPHFSHTIVIIKGVIFSTYVLFESNDYLILLDQHAAHERVLYEKLKREAGESAIKKSLLIPITFTPPRIHLEDLTENLETFHAAGIGIEPFGEESFNIVEIPAFVPENREEETLSVLLEEFYEGKLKITTRDIRDRFIKIAACRHAVKEGDMLTQEEVFRLLEDLGQTEAPHICPHGRPTVIKQRKEYFEKLLRLKGRGLQCFSFKKNDCPGKNREENEDQKDQLYNKTGINYELENVHGLKKKSSICSV